MTQPPEVTIVTGTLDRPEPLRRMVESLRKHETGVTWEVIVADAGTAAVPPLGPGVRVIPEKPRLGWTKGYNAAFAHGTGKYFVWLNDDVEWTMPVLPAAIRLLRDNPRVGMAAIPFWDNGIFVEFQQHRSIPYASFGVISADLFRRVGGFDGRIYMYGCDNTIAFRVLLAGYGIKFLPRNVHLVHHRHQDEHRMANEKTQPEDVSRLDAIYGRHYDAMRATQAHLMAQG
jgi:GT2 family glycosyltransferase